MHVVKAESLGWFPLYLGLVYDVNWKYAGPSIWVHGLSALGIIISPSVGWSATMAPWPWLEHAKKAA
jgi:hypothetical protein